MNKLFIIGNGFDLAHGLKTSYSDFFLWYLQKAVKRAHTDLSYMDDLITIPRQTILDAGRFNSFAEFRRLNIQIRPKTDLFGRLMRNTNSLNWVDIEYAYYENLYHFYNQYEKGFLDKNEAIDNVVALNKSLDLIKSELHEYLTTIDGNLNEPNFEIKEHFRLELDNESWDSFKKRYSDVMFLNFNYTSTIELYHDEFKKYPTKVNHIH
ncbi:MAG: AbiH family protein, partial [Bacteroidia bacterium]